MKRSFVGAIALIAAVALVRCGPSQTPGNGNENGTDNTPPDAGTTPVTPTDAGQTNTGPVDSGTPVIPDAGTPVDAGTPDAGEPVDAGMPDAGPPDAGNVTTITFPTAAGWKFYGKAQGGPTEVYGISADQGGNIWVAGGEEGLFLLRPNAATFEKFTMANGLRPYGYMPDGSDAPGPHYLKVLSVAGGPAGTVFVGYAGKPPAAGQYDCEHNWDGPNPDPNIYKSGDADKVTLKSGGGINVVHYDIFSGPDVVADEVRGREKVCSILRMAYDPATDSIWFGGNHGFAWGKANFNGNATCNGQLNCAGNWEHVHPATCGTVGDHTVLLTDSYYGVSVDPASGDVWFGGLIRATRFRMGTYGDYWAAQVDTEAGNNTWSRIDVWPDQLPEDQCPTAAQRKDDDISGMAVMGDGTVWVSSYSWGLAHLDGNGNVMSYKSSDLIAPHVSALSRDKWDGSLWAGHRWGGGITRLKSGEAAHISEQVFGMDLAQHPVWDIQMDKSSSTRRVLVAFQALENNGTIQAGAIGVYTGN